MNTYEIPIQLFEDFEKEIKKLNSKAKKLNIQEIKYNKLENIIFKRNKDIEVPCYIVEVEQEEQIKLQDYIFVAKLEKNIGDTFIYFGHQDVPKEQKNIKICQHCNSNRQRKHLYILRNHLNDKYITVGKSCLVDFIGHANADKIAEYFQKFKDIANNYNVEDINDYNSFNQEIYSLNQVLRVSCASIESRGYFSVDYDGLTTKEHVIYVLNNYVEDKEARKVMNNAMNLDSEKIELIKEIILSQKNDNDFIINLKFLIKDECINKNMIGLACCIPKVAQNIIEKEKQKRFNKESNYIGVIKEKVELNVVFDTQILINSYYYGDAYMYFFYDEDFNVVIWKTDRLKKFNKEEIFKMKATVKSHEEYQGIKQTFVIRPKFEKIEKDRL